MHCLYTNVELFYITANMVMYLENRVACVTSTKLKSVPRTYRARAKQIHSLH